MFCTYKISILVSSFGILYVSNDTSVCCEGGGHQVSAVTYAYSAVPTAGSQHRLPAPRMRSAGLRLPESRAQVHIPCQAHRPGTHFPDAEPQSGLIAAFTCKNSNEMSGRDSIYMQTRKQTKLQALKQVQTGRTYIGSKHRGPKAGERHNVISSTKGQGEPEGFKFIPSRLTC